MMDNTGDMIAQFHDKFSRHVAKITNEDETEVILHLLSSPPLPFLPLPPPLFHLRTFRNPSQCELVRRIWSADCWVGRVG